MSRSSIRWLIAPVIVALALFVAACGSDDNKSSTSGGSAGVSAGGKPVDGQKKGGHLTILSAGDVDNIDPGQAYYGFTYQVIYPIVRPLYSFKPDNDGTDAQPDLAEGKPEVTDGGKTITIRSRRASATARPTTRK